MSTSCQQSVAVVSPRLAPPLCPTMQSDSFPLLEPSLPPSFATSVYGEPGTVHAPVSTGPNLSAHESSTGPRMFAPSSSASPSSPGSDGDIHDGPARSTSERSTAPTSSKLSRDQRMSRRREQNRNAQRALRRRKETRLSEVRYVLTFTPSHSPFVTGHRQTDMVSLRAAPKPSRKYAIQRTCFDEAQRVIANYDRFATT